jgi:hypothetical protein
MLYHVLFSARFADIIHKTTIIDAHCILII